MEQCQKSSPLLLVREVVKEGKETNNVSGQRIHQEEQRPEQDESKTDVNSDYQVSENLVHDTSKNSMACNEDPQVIIIHKHETEYFVKDDPKFDLITPKYTLPTQSHFLCYLGI